METPIYTRLTEYHRKNRISFAMPGHKNLRGLAPDLLKCDVTELLQTVDLHSECETAERANTLLSEHYGTKKSFIMTGGSTAGIQAMLASVLKPGDTLLAFSDCHMSVINTCAICGYKLKMVAVKYDEEFLVPRDIPDIEIAEDIKAMLVTSPNYYGITKDIVGLAYKCSRANIPLLVDEAHGAHFEATTDDGVVGMQTPISAVSLGADMVCHSAHKTLGALTGAAYLHVCSERIDINRVKRVLRSFQSSSPSYVIAASADFARAALEETDYACIVDECNQFKNAITDMTKIKALPNNDKTRIVLNFSAYSITGFEVDKRLSEYYGIDIEMSDYSNIVLIATPYNTHSDFMVLFHALRDITSGLELSNKKDILVPPPVPDGVISPSDGWYADTECIDIDKSEDRISASTVTVYPPGTAVIVTGGRITKEAISYIKMSQKLGAKLTGISDNGIEVVI